jgi:uracil-DNA glycosylase
VSTSFCPGYPEPYAALVDAAPDATVYPADGFRVEWGPIFHRGRLDGSAQVLVLGQDPAVLETVARRILVGTAGQRTQGLLAKLGITQTYTMVNTYLYSVWGQSAADQHIDDVAIADYRQRWLTTLVAHNEIRAVLTLGSLAAKAFTAWRATADGSSFAGHHAALIHPTYPESAAATGQITRAEATKRLLTNWNEAIPGITAAVPHPDLPPTGVPYGDAFTPADLAPIPAADLPAGLRWWLGGAGAWGGRSGGDADTKRATITITIPDESRPWTPI